MARTRSTRSHPVTFLPMAAGYASLMGHHRHLLDDRVRTRAFLRAIAAVVAPGDAVADLGTGSGVLAFAARRAGARSVWAIDHDPIVRVAAEVARANGIDGITFVEQLAKDAAPAEPIDVLVSECFGPFAIGGSMIAAFTELRDRVLAPGGRTIPERVTLVVAPVEDAALARYVGAFATRRYDVDWSAAHALATNNVFNTLVAPRALLARGTPLATIDLGTDRYRGSLDATIALTTTRAGRCHGFAGWFVAELGGGVTLSTAPGKPATIWRQVVFPLPRAIVVGKGTPIELTIRGHGEHFDWSGAVGATAFTSSTRYSHPAALPSAVPRAASSRVGEVRPRTAAAAARKRSSGEP
ncbi:MAG: 50S ribosomal protein L11 methyltransferase [Proteobacteria bacterium]|nr:50S ribosomal protein L11 methyltransferase [Pseudomonadota bacterium]